MDEWMTLRYYNILVARRPKIKRKQSKKKRKANDILQMSKKKKKKKPRQDPHIGKRQRSSKLYTGRVGVRAGGAWVRPILVSVPRPE